MELCRFAAACLDIAGLPELGTPGEWRDIDAIPDLVIPADFRKALLAALRYFVAAPIDAVDLRETEAVPGSGTVEIEASSGSLSMQFHSVEKIGTVAS